MSVVIISTFKPMLPEFIVEQTNALRSWKLLRCNPRVVIIGDEQGVKELCERENVIHHPEVKRTESGSPLIADLFHQGWKYATDEDIVIYVNGDIILSNDLCDTLDAFKIACPDYPKMTYLLTAMRYNWFDIKEIDFTEENWADQLNTTKDGPEAIDIFIHRKGTIKNIPVSGIARFAYDSWLISTMINEFDISIDITNTAKIYHQFGLWYMNGKPMERIPFVQDNYNKFPGDVMVNCMPIYNYLTATGLWDKIVITSCKYQSSKSDSIYFTKYGGGDVLTFDLPLVSIITPVKDGVKYIQELLDSVLTQTIPVEHIIQDSISTDGTSEIIQSYARKYPFIKHIREPDASQTDGKDRAIQRSTGKYFIVMNGDDYLVDDSLRKITLFLESNGGDAAVSSQTNIVNGNSKVCHKTDNRIWTMKELLLFHHPPQFNSILWRRYTYNKNVGRLDLNLKSAPDFDFLVRWTNQPANVYLYHGTVINYRVHAESGSHTTDMVPVLYESKRRVLDSYFTYLSNLPKDERYDICKRHGIILKQPKDEAEWTMYFGALRCGCYAKLLRWMYDIFNSAGKDVGEFYDLVKCVHPVLFDVLNEPLRM